MINKVKARRGCAGGVSWSRATNKCRSRVFINKDCYLDGGFDMYVYLGI